MQTLRYVAAAASALLLGVALPAQADPQPPAEDALQASSYAPSSTLLADATAAATTATQRLETDKRTRPVAPGVSLTSFDRYDALGWLRGDAVTADLGGARADYLYSGEVTKTEPLSGPAKRARAVVAVNGDFFDINASGAAQGVGVQDGTLIQSPVAGHENAVAITGDGVGRVLKAYFEGTATPAGGAPITLTQFNQVIQKDGVGLFTPLWGSYPRARAVEGASAVTEVVLKDGVVAEVRQAAGTGPVPAGTTVLLGRDAGAAALAALKAGDRIDVAYRPKTSDGSTLKAAVGGNYVLVKDGVVQNSADPAAHPRTAVGFSADGRTMYLLTVDGRQADSRGVTLNELAAMMAELGAANALNLDGGGSSTMLAREPGQADVQVENSPSDGGERHVPNGLALFAPEGSGKLKGFWLETAGDPSRVPGTGPVAGGRPDRVFPGLTRRLTAAGYDETYGPAAGTPAWRSEPAVHGVVRDGRFHALVPGQATVTASRGAAKGTLELTVLQPLRRLGLTTDRVGLPGASGSATFGVVGYDRNGNSAPIEPADLSLSYDKDLFEVTPADQGYFTVKAKKETGSGLITAKVGSISAAVPVTVGFEDKPVAGFDDAASWTFAAARATGSLSATTGQSGGGLKLAYDFTQSTATRAAYASPPQQIVVPGQPQAFGMWINSTGKGEWPSLEFYDALGQSQILRGPYMTWTGWKYVEFAVPAGVNYPLKLRRFYVAETRADQKYANEIVIDGLVAKVPPSVTAPPAAKVTDPVVRPDVAAMPWRFAVMSDAQFVARDPDSDIVRNARRTLREIKAAKPDFLLINGDLVDEASPEDFALAKRILDEELGGELPYHYVPGNHEVMGGKIDNFKAVFGDTYKTFDHKGTRFVTLDTSRLNLRGGGFEQVAMLREQLDAAARDASVGSVAVLFHVPPRDPTPGKGSQLGDRKEAALVEQWLADFQRTTGKGAAYIGAHVGTFHASRVDAVPYFINGNSGKNPATAADDGGFTGWSLWGVDPVTEKEAEQVRRNWFVDAPAWIGTQVRPHLDELTLTAPATLAAGGTGRVAAEIRQGTRTVPAAYPVSAAWSGSPNLHVGPARTAKPWHVAVLDPETGTLTARRAGQVTVAVTVSGVTRQATVAITAKAAA
ncbi:phosphodiester glycosidase family protein [Nonomuraea roseoviolacea]|uniref:3',5'-cyclic AMP phosphodiesterase CpdA n=1 Tax=Nonomuraea roseoviolacea subsp. carminata TaxID=160689 RepID=A0ABT1KEN7_9ACTN|nr:phosphodiester glycosidase family protein [Nonomuraea roseoviolacea]MCP2352451.1 3',5'-cyclic AMP phosphodiesterase CpdA [Nonomuraea roseoviolacea subsp. carminata]